MTDRELLELAAKAAGLKPGTWFDGWNDEGRETGDHWNPLISDGEALRLAVKLGIIVCCIPYDVHFTGVYLPADRHGGKYDFVYMHHGDPYAATRRAIVRAAAEIGRKMP